VYNLEEEYIGYVQEIGGKLIHSENPSKGIRETRTALGATQEEVSRLMDLRRETISRIETGIINPTFGFVKKFSRVMAAAKIIRDLNALEEVSVLDGRNFTLSPAILRAYFNVSANNFQLIVNIGTRGYQKSRAKIVKEIREVG
ncbi:MAG: helix-turn-helix transcriptional regulator, partial [Candidatus Hydrothermarchaeaceae archaeon]